MVTVTREDIEAGWRPLTDAEAATVPALSVYAWRLLSTAVPGLERRTDRDEDLAELVRLEMVMAIRRVLANPDFTRQVSTTVDDATVSRTIDSSVSSGALYFPPDVLDRLRPRRHRGAFSVRAVW